MYKTSSLSTSCSFVVDSVERRSSGCMSASLLPNREWRTEWVRPFAEGTKTPHKRTHLLRVTANSEWFCLYIDTSCRESWGEKLSWQRSFKVAPCCSLLPAQAIRPARHMRIYLWSASAILTSSGSDSARILRITRPRWIFTVTSLIPSSPAICLFKRPLTTSCIT